MKHYAAVRVGLVCAVLTVWATVVWCEANATAFENPFGGLTGGSFEDDNGHLDSSYAQGSVTAAVTMGNLAAADPSLTKQIYGGAYDCNQFTGTIEATRARWDVQFTARMVVKVNSWKPQNYANKMEVKSRCELLMWGNLNSNGWDAKEVFARNEEQPGDYYDISVRVNGQSEQVQAGGQSFAIGDTYSAQCFVLWTRYREATDVQFTYESVSWGSMEIDFSNSAEAGVTCESRHAEGSEMPPWDSWDGSAIATDLDTGETKTFFFN